MQEDCLYNEKKVYEANPGTVLDAAHCQEICVNLGDAFGAKYWVFEAGLYSTDGQSHCTLYEEFNPGACTVIQGPETPNLDECGYGYI